MKSLISIVLIFSIISCKSKKSIEGNTPVGQQWNIELQNNLGNVSLILPVRFDTLFSWDQTSDCGDPCTKVDYRIQRKEYPIFKERGWYWLPLLDSVDQFTVKHSKINYPDNPKDLGSLKYIEDNLKAEVPTYYKIKIDTTLSINEKIFYVLGYSIFDSVKKATYYNLNAGTILNKNVLVFYFEHRSKSQDSISPNFINSSFDYLKTIKINGG